ncbi:MAG: hypothetical protein HYS27_05840 [Deltaproteobacteria bacterium]|nr:hypothetical protein [Deltaproteobacteria bacterium]
MGTAARQVVRFFDDVLPDLIRQRARTFGQTQGALTIMVEGVGSWTVTFGDARSPTAIVDEADTEADCIVVWAKDAFATLLGTPAPSVPPSESGPIAVVGEIKLLARLGSLLDAATAKGQLGPRLAQVLTAV